MDQEILGAGGGGKGGGGSARVAVEAPDSLRSKQYATVIDAISEGEIVGLVNGMQSIYLNDTPLQASDGTMNFKGVTYHQSVGTPNAVKKGGIPAYFPANSAQVMTGVGVEVKYDTPVIRRITSSEVDYVDVIVGLPQLTHQDMSNGDVNGTSVNIAVDLQINGGGYVPQVFNQIWTTGGATKIDAGYYRSDDADCRGFRVSVPGVFAHSGAYMQYRRVGETNWRTDGVRTTFGSRMLALFLPQTLNPDSHYETPVLPSGQWEARVVRSDGTPLVSSVTYTTRYGATSTLPVVTGYARMTGVDYDIISGKTTSRYQRTYRIPLSGTGPWDIRVRRLTEDSTKTALQNKTFFDAYVEGINVKLNYANTAAVMLTIDAEQFSSVPRRGYEIMGLKVRVPSNYDPYTRAYSGSWDGSFKVEWTDNPAWCYYDMLTNTRYGLGEFINAENVDKWGLYQIARYCDELVPDGRGNVEPRFTCNLYLQSREDAYRVITQMASIFRGMCYWANDQVIAIQDAPADPVALFTTANIIDGTFNYQSSDRRVRHTVALVSWNDPQDYYKQKIEHVQDDEAVARYGVVQTEILAVGCTSRGQAHRLAKWLLHTEQNETEAINFRAGLDAAQLAPGDIIVTQDPIRSGERMGGRIKSMVSQTKVELDAPIDIITGKTYELSIVMPDSRIETRSVVGSERAGAVLIVNQAFSAVPVANAIWVVNASNLIAEKWRVVSIKEVEPTVVEIAATAHHPGKYAAVENGIELQELPTSLVGTTPEAPHTFTTIENHYPLTVGAPGFRLMLSWVGTSPRYSVQWRREGDNWASAELMTPTITIDNVSAGNYEFKLQATNSIGKKSPVVTHVVAVQAKLPLPDAVPFLNMAVSNKEVISLTWGQVSNPYIIQYEVRDTDSGWGEPGAIFRGAATSCTMLPKPAGATTAAYVRVMDYQGQHSATSAVASMVVAAPEAPVVASQFISSDLVLSWSTPVSTFRVDAYEVRYGSSWATGIVAGRINGTQLTIPVSWLGGRTFWVAAIDMYGNIGAPASKVVEVLSPKSVSSVQMLYDLAQSRLSWVNNPGTLPIAHNEVRRGATWEIATLVGKSYTNTLNLEVSWKDSATFWVKTVDVNGNESPITQYITTIAPPGPVSVAHQFKDGIAVLTWSAPSSGSLAIRSYEVRAGANWETGTVVGSTSDQTYSIPVNWTTSKTFWVAAVDMAGNIGTAGSRVVTYTPYSAPTGLTQSISQATVTLTWQPSVGGALPIKHYDIRFGGEWGTGQVLARSNTTSITLPITWLGSRTIWVSAVDTNDQYGASASIPVSVSAPSAPSVSSVLVVAKAELSWTVPSATLPIQQYEIRHGSSWAAGTLVAQTFSTAYRAPVDWVGDRTFWVAAIDVNGNVGTPGSSLVTVTAPAAPTITSSFSLDQFNLTWSQPTSSLPIDEFEVRHGDTWGAGTSVGRVKGTVFTKKAQWVGARSWWVAAIDLNGNIGTPGAVNVTISPPSAPGITKQVVDNNVLLNWQHSTGTLPVTTYEVRRGETWETGTLIGQKSGGFTTIFETAAGIYTYMIAGIDSAGNYGTPASVSVSVSQPPDYVLRADENLDFSGTKVNMQLDADGSYMMPVNTTETFEEHFASRSWASPDSQVAAGYPVFAQPALSPGYYEHEIDYGTLLSGTKISVTPTGSVVSGNPTLQIDISTRASISDQWTTVLNTSSVYTNNFRYVRVRFTVSGTMADLYRLGNLNVKLDAKIRSDAGRETLKVGGAHVNGNIGHDYLDIWKSGISIAAVPGFALNGGANENAIVDIGGPSGISEAVWACIDADTASDTDGGWSSAYFPANCDGTGHLFAVFMKASTIAGTSYWGTSTNSSLSNLSGTVLQSNPYFWTGDLPSLETWYLVVGYVHSSGYGTVDTGISGVYDLNGTKLLSGTEFKATPGTSQLMHRAYHYYNAIGSGQQVQHMARPVVIPCSEAEASEKIQYILQCATKPGALARFNVPFIDIASVSVSPAGTTPSIAVYDFLDVPNPKRFNIFNYTTSGVITGGDVAWSVRGY